MESAKKSKFGKYIVEIKSPKQLAIKMTDWLANQPHKHFGGIEGINIEYTYGENVKIKPTNSELSTLTYSQKPSSFSDENEFRFIFIRKTSNDDDVFINLGEVLEFCQIIQQSIAPNS